MDLKDLQQKLQPLAETEMPERLRRKVLNAIENASVEIQNLPKRRRHRLIWVGRGLSAVSAAMIVIGTYFFSQIGDSNNGNRSKHQELNSGISTNSVSIHSGLKSEGTSGNNPDVKQQGTTSAPANPPSNNSDTTSAVANRTSDNSHTSVPKSASPSNGSEVGIGNIMIPYLVVWKNNSYVVTSEGVRNPGKLIGQYGHFSLFAIQNINTNEAIAVYIGRNMFLKATLQKTN